MHILDGFIVEVPLTLTNETLRPQVLSFPVHSMGWIELEENKVAPHNMSETISECISILATKRNDLWNTSLTWGEVIH